MFEFTADRLNHFYVRVGNQSEVSSHKVCGYQEQPFPRGGHGTITCPEGLVGRYVSIQLSKDTEHQHFLNFCEAVVMGYTYKGM